MKHFLIVIKLIFISSFYLSAQDSLHYRFSFGASLGAAHHLEKNTNDNIHLSTLPDESDVYGSFSISYLFEKSIGIITSANIAEYSTNDELYNQYVQSLYPEYYIISPFNYNCRLYTIRAGLMYVLKVNKFEVVPQIVAGSYFKFEPVEPDILLKEKGSNVTKSITYDATEVNDKINISALLLLKYNIKSWWGVNVSGEYYYFKPLVTYEIITQDLLQETKREEYSQELNLSWLAFSIGLHFNFLK